MKITEALYDETNRFRNILIEYSDHPSAKTHAQLMRASMDLSQMLVKWRKVSPSTTYFDGMYK